MRVLVLGWYYSSNLGDAVICDCVAAMLRKADPNTETVIRDLAGRTAFPQRKPADLKQFAKLRSRQKLRNTATRLGWDKQLSHQQWCLNQYLPYLDAVTEGTWDLVVFAGGQLFMDSLALYVEYHVRALAARQIPVIFNACGTGPSVSPAIQRRLSQALQMPNVRWVSCRDDFETVNKWCGIPLAVPTDDPALWAGECYGVAAHPSETVGLGILWPNSISPERTAQFWRRLIRELDRRKISWKFFSNGFEQDLEFARSLLDGRPEETFLCPAPETPEELVRLIGSFRSIIGFRLHSQILAASLGIPGVAMNWDQKVPRFFEKMGMPDRCFPIDTQAEKVVDTLLEAERHPIKPEVRNMHREHARAMLLHAADEAGKGER